MNLISFLFDIMRHRSKQAILFLEVWGIRVLMAAAALFFVLAWLEHLGQDGDEPVSVWRGFLDTLTADAGDSLWHQLYNVSFILAAGWAGIKAYMAALGLKLDVFFVRLFCNDHLVILAGQGGRGGQDQGAVSEQSKRALLAIELAETSAASHTVVLCLQGVDENTRRRLWARGVHVLQDDLSPSDLLLLARVSRARWLISMRDNVNDSILSTMVALAATDTHDERPECRIMVDPGLEMQSLDKYFKESEMYRVRGFSDAELISRHLMNRFPPETGIAQLAARRVHLLLVGLGSVGQAVLVRMAHLGHYRNGLRPRISIAEDEKGKNWQTLNERHPKLKELLDLRFLQGGIADKSREALKSWLQGQDDPTMVYVCTKDELFNFRITRLLIEVLPDPATRFVVLDPPGGSVLVGMKANFDKDDNTRGRVEIFSLAGKPEGGCGSPLTESLIDNLDDQIPRAIHNHYNKHILKSFEANQAWEESEEAHRGANADISSDKTVQKWEEIKEAHRESNRWAGDHFHVKIRAIGLELVSIDDTRPAADLMPSELELLANMEHARWDAEKAFSGNLLGDSSSARRTLVPFEYLTDSELDKDKNQIVNLISYLTSNGEEGGGPFDRHQKLVRMSEGPQPILSEDVPASVLLRLSRHVLDIHPPQGRTPRVLVQGSGHTAEEFVCEWIKRSLITGSRSTLFWATRDEPSAQARLHARFSDLDQRIECIVLEQEMESMNTRIKTIPLLCQQAPDFLTAIYLCPDPGERLPGSIDSLADSLRVMAKEDRKTELDIVALSWSPAPCADVEPSYLGAAHLNWVAAREVLTPLKET